MVSRDDPRSWYENARARVPVATDRGQISEEDVEAIFELLDALDDRIEGIEFRTRQGYTKTLASKTLANYTTRLRLAATELDGGLLAQENSSIDRLIRKLVDGSSSVGPEKGYAKGTIGQYQSALKAFYRYHNGHQVVPREIKITPPAKTSIGVEDMFSVGEIRAMRNAIDTPRERCLFELLAYTGQRIRAIQTLRIKDIDLESGLMRLNEQEEGLKGASGVRPLLGAEPYVREWIGAHPTNKDPDSFLITPLPTHGGGGTPGGMLTQESMRYHLRKIARHAGIERDIHPHLFRHYFTTIAKTKYGLDDAFIRHLRGDSPGSKVMETTYQHISDKDAVNEAIASQQGKEAIVDSPLSPESNCPNCGIKLPTAAKACFKCGALFTPDALLIREAFSESLSEPQ